MVELNVDYSKVCKDIYAQEFVMAVSKVFFLPYYHVLTALQSMKSEEFPMKKYIVDVCSEPQPPAYIKGQICPGNYSSTAEKLNSSQKKAFEAALTKEFVAIQGPPGTGKTFLGLQIVSELLDSAVTNTPILVVCYKNHALDQFLEGILNKTKKVIRIGGRSTNKKLKDYNLKDRRGHYGYQFHGDSLQVLAIDYISTENQMVELRKKGIVSIQNVVQYIESPRFRDELLSIHMDDWLMEGMYMNEDSNNVHSQDCRSVHIESKIGRKKELKKHFSCQNTGNIVPNISSHKIYDCSTHTYGSTEQDGTEQDDIRNNWVKHLKENNNTKDNLLYNSDNICVGSLISFDCPLYTDDFLESEEGENQAKNVDFVCDIETYIDDYSNVYKDFPKEVEQRKWNSRPKISTKTGMDQNYFETLNPQFTLTINCLEEVIRDDRIKIKNLLEDENISEKVREHWLSVLVTEIKDIENRLTFLKKMLSHKMCFKPKKTTELYALGERFGIGALDNVQRWYLYHSWINCLADDMRSYMIELEKTIRFEEQKLDEARGRADLAALRKAKVVGVTTSGAAKNRSTLNELGANIVVIEEAAEVLESHIVASLSSKCEHLILIGDHKQLRPNPAVYELCTKYNLDISLFERMVRNGLSCHTLDVQHRMRPEFAALITPSIYVHLENHLTTENRPDIRGIHKNLYFINHNKPEEKVRETESHVNKFEAGFVLELAKYLLKQGYSTDEITILATYSGQVKQIIKMRDYTMRDLKITTVDDFQGEENKIIILSLVRSNEEGNIGFLKAENRVCVALSRARDGLYIFGNMDCLTKKSQIWPQVKEKLLENNALGATLSVYCQKHQKTTQVKNGPMFKDMLEGGCSLKCKEKLSCGHVCEYHCHIPDQQHEKKYMCPKPCKRKPCRMQHPCQKVCGEKCGPCMRRVEFNLACGHNMLAACSSDPKELLCRTVMPCTLPCGHESTRLCSETEEKQRNKKCKMACNKKLWCGHGCSELCGHLESCDSFECKAEVDVTLECGHKVKVECCKRRKPQAGTIKVETSPDQVELFPQDFDEPIKCTEKADTKLGCGHINLLPCGLSKKELQNVLCSEPVSKILPCGHQLTVECSNSQGKPMCRKPCKKTMRCGHLCEKMCSDFCSCEIIVKKELPCGHIVRALCGVNDVTCNHPCTRNLACGHICQDKCGEKCGTTPCPKIVKKKLPCGHKVRAPCGANDVTCNHPCLRNLACGHVCQDKCGEKCGTTPCQTLTPSTLNPSCGHGPVTVPCFNTIGGAKLSADKLADFCTAECATILPCNHLCTGKCGNCRRQRTHAKCNQQCAKTLPCSHQCPRKCSEQCGNCYQPCLNKCSHKNCDRLCGEPCNLCQEPCDRGCVHSRCHRPCFAYCDRLPCSLPCPYLLPCLHPCLGFCGEVCPPVCLKCDPQYVQTILGNATSRLVVLEDCGHIVDATRMEAFMSRNKSCIVKCPIMSCQTPVVTTKQYHKEVTGALYSIMNMKREMEAKRNGIFNTQNVSSFRSLRNIEKFTRDRAHSHGSSPFTQMRVEQPPLGRGSRVPWTPQREMTRSRPQKNNLLRGTFLRFGKIKR